MAPTSSHIGILLAIIFTICIFDLVFVWRTLENELEPQQQQKQEEQQYYSSENTAQLHQPNINSTTSITDVPPEKQRAYQILLSAGVAEPIPAELIAKLPAWSDIVSQYGSEPIVANLESCSKFRAAIPKRERFVAVAGMFNTGTNLLANLITKNCQIDGHKTGTGMRIQVPWGKHNPPVTHRLRNVAKIAGKGINQTTVFPLVIIKDPYHWATSQCRHKYFTNWEHDAEHCPNIVNYRHTRRTKRGEPTKVSVKYALERVEYETLLGQWNGWYEDYEDQTNVYPLAILRFEDMLFHANEVINQLCSCVGGRRRNHGHLLYPMDSAKPDEGTHAGSNGLTEALIRYGDPKKRMEGWTREDWNYARDHLDEGLMERYGYSWPDPP